MQAPATADPSSFRFDEFDFVPERGLLRYRGMPLRLGRRALAILAALLEQSGKVVAPATLMARAWPGISVAASNLKVQVAALRKALGAAAPGRVFIATVRQGGYRFLHPVDSGAGPAAPPEALPQHNLPCQSRTGPDALIGRATAARDVARRLRRHRLVTITGPGGVGKTSLALALAGRALAAGTPGPWFLDLSRLQDPRHAAHALAHDMRLGPHAGDAMAVLIPALEGQRALLLLDCCERAPAQAAALAGRLLAAAPGLRILATSRAPLGLAQECLYPLPPLALPAAPGREAAMASPAVRLFLRRARARSHHFAPAPAEMPLVVELCRRLDGLPLAIELAAVRAEAFGLQYLLEWLADRFLQQQQGRRGDPPRHQGLQASLDWSHALLSAAERRAFRRLAVLPGPFALELGVALAGDAGEPAEAVRASILALAAQSLLAPSPNAARAVSGATAYRLLDTTRAYAAAKLAESGEAATLRRRHALLCLTLCRQGAAAPELLLNHMQAALDWASSPAGDPLLARRLTAAALPLWQAYSMLGDCIARVTQTLAQPIGTAPEDQRDEILCNLALAVALLQTQGPVPRVAACWRNALALAGRLGDAELRLQALWGLCDYRSWTGRHQAALALAGRSQALALAGRDPLAALNSTRQRATSLRYLGRLAEGRRLAEQLMAQAPAAAAAGEIGRLQNDPRIVAQGTLANLLWLQGQPMAAAQAADAALARAEQSGHAFALTNALAHTAIPIALYRGDFARAETLLASLQAHVARHAMPIWRAIGNTLQAQLLLGLGQAEGLPRLGAALERLHDTGFRMRFPAYLGAFASALLAAGQPDRALPVLEAALGQTVSGGEAWCRAELLRLRGESLAARGKEEAIPALRQALTLARRQGALAWELRAATSLALHGGAPPGALLAPLLTRCEAGAASRDLAAASQLLRGTPVRSLICILA